MYEQDACNDDNGSDALVVVVVLLLVIHRVDDIVGDEAAQRYWK
jgi:hypothetical protein